MTRLLAALAAILLFASPALGDVGASPSGSPGASPSPSANPSRYARMLTELSQVNIDLTSADTKIQTDLGTLDGAQGKVTADEQNLGFGTLPADLAAVQLAADTVANDLQQIVAIAGQGIAVLDRWTPDSCFYDLWAVERTAFLLYADAVDAVASGDSTSVGQRISRARYLLGEYAGLIEGVTECLPPANAA